MKINAILDDASNETFLHEEVTGVLGLQEPFQKVQVHVLNDRVETFHSMPLKIEIESVDGQFSKEINVKTCLQKVTGNYKVVNWNEHQNKWPHLTQCSFAKPANNGLRKKLRRNAYSCKVWRLDPKRFSSWTRLVRVHARVRRVLHNLPSRDDRKAGIELPPKEIKDTEEEIVSLAQREAFHDEYTALSLGKPILQKSQLIKLKPCIDEDGVIRCDGRLKFAEFLPSDTRCPIILPRGHRVTKLIVNNHHERANHAAGVNFTLYQLSERFWIIAAREEIREWDHEYNKCK